MSQTNGNSRAAERPHNARSSNEEPKPSNRLGRFLREYRQRTLTPLADIAADMNRYPSSVAKLETQADHAWTLYSLQRYARAVGARVGVVLVFEGEDHKPGCVLAEPPPAWRSRWERGACEEL